MIFNCFFAHICPSTVPIEQHSLRKHEKGSRRTRDIPWERRGQTNAMVSAALLVPADCRASHSVSRTTDITSPDWLHSQCSNSNV